MGKKTLESNRKDWNDAFVYNKKVLNDSLQKTLPFLHLKKEKLTKAS